MGKQKTDRQVIKKWYLKGTDELVARVRMIRHGKATMEWRVSGKEHAVEKHEMEKR